MNKILTILMVAVLSIWISGCEDKEIQVLITEPEDGFTVNGLSFTINGVIHNSNASYFFYQVEDGHSFIGEGTLTADENGYFTAEVLLDNPSNDSIVIWSVDRQTEEHPLSSPSSGPGPADSAQD